MTNLHNSKKRHLMQCSFWTLSQRLWTGIFALQPCSIRNG